SVTVPAGATSVTFSDTTNTISADQVATLTATYNSSTASTTLNLTAGAAAVSALSCNPGSLAPGGTGVCTVTLTKAPPAGGATVPLTNSNPPLTVPAAVLVGGAAASANFNVSTGNFSGTQTATLTAAYGGGSASVTVGLAGPAGPVSVTCSSTTLGGGGYTSC